MSDSIASRIREMARKHDAGLRVDILIRIATGIGFSLLTFGFVYWFFWVFGFVAAHHCGLEPWQFAALITGVFFAVATWSAWQRVDPLAAVRPMTSADRLMVLVTRAAGIGGFSPRHAVGGAATALIGGPANFVQALGIANSRLGATDVRIASAARLLESCRQICPIKKVKDAEAAALLRRLALIKFVPLDYSHRIALTEKGEKLLRAVDKKSKRKDP
jgi:hypothetical protein